MGQRVQISEHHLKSDVKAIMAELSIIRERIKAWSGAVADEDLELTLYLLEMLVLQLHRTPPAGR